MFFTPTFLGMGSLRKVVTILTVLAVAANPAAASFMPCCCVGRERPQKRNCCLKRAADPAEDGASCCATKKAVGRRQECSRPAIERQPCCCIKSLPAAPPAQQAGPQHQLDLKDSLVTTTVMVADSPPVAERIRRLWPGLVFPISPPLSVLYCVWVE